MNEIITEESEKNGYQLRYYVTLPTLQEMACYKVAINAWYSFIRPRYEKGSRSLTNLEIYNEKARHCPSLALRYELKSIMPLIFCEMVELCYYRIIDEVNNWIKHLNLSIPYYLFGYDSEKSEIEPFDLNCLIWYPNGKINFRATAAEMISSTELSPKKRFAIMCEYCMKDEITKFSLDSFVGNLKEELYVYERMSTNYIIEELILIYYWICYLKNELDKIPLNGMNSLDHKMLSQCVWSPGYAFEYFRDRLSSDDPSLVSITKSRFECTAQFQDRLLGKMSWHQQRKLLNLIPVKIILNFCIDLRLPESAFWAWQNTKHILTGRQFAGLVNKILTSEVIHDEGGRLLTEMWDTAPDNLKHYYVEAINDEMIKAIFSTSLKQSKPATAYAYDFLHRVLSLKSVECRKEMIFKLAVWLAENFDESKWLNDLINLCLPSIDDILEFKKYVLNCYVIESYCIRLLNDASFQTLTRKLKYYSPDTNFARRYIENNLFRSCDLKKCTFIDNNELWSKLSDFVNDWFADSSVYALHIKKKFVSSCAGTLFFELNCPNVKNVSNIVESIFQGDELVKIKGSIFNGIRSYFGTRNVWWLIPGYYELNFISWCLSDDEKALLEYKVSIPIDRVFDQMFDFFCNNYSDMLDSWLQDYLRKYDCCLMWLLSDVEKVKSYKLQRMKKFYRIKLIKITIERRLLQMLLNWFYSDDENKVKLFKAEHNL